MPKGRSPYAGPFRIVEVLVCHSYRLSDGQKWNSRHLKHFLPSSMEWTILSPSATDQPQGGVGGVEAQEGVVEEEAILPDPVAAAPVQPWYPMHD